MTTPPNQSSSKSFRLAALLGGSASILVAALGILGWLLQSRALTSVHEKYIPIALSTCVSFLVLGGILIWHVHRPSQARRWPFVVAVAWTSLFGLLTFLDHFAQLALDLEGTMLSSGGRFAQFPINRMSPLTGLLFLGAGVALWTLLRGGRRGPAVDLASGLSIGVAAMGLMGTIGYVYGTPLLYKGTVIPLALTTSLGFVFLGAGLFAAAGPDSLLLRPFTGSSARATLLRTFVPLAFAAVIGSDLLQHLLIQLNSALVSAASGVLFGLVAIAVVVQAARVIGGAIEKAEAEREIAEEALRESEERFRLIANSMPQVAWTARPDGTVDYLNAYFEEYTGRPRCGGRAALKPIHPEDLRKTMAVWKHAVESGEAYQIEHRLRRRDGEYRWFLSRGIPVRDESRRIIKWYGSSADIHELKMVEEELQASQARLRRAEAIAHLGHWSHDLRSNVVFWSDEMCRIYGFGREAGVPGPPCEKLPGFIHPEDRERHNRSFDAILEGGKAGFEYRIVRSDGEVRHVSGIGEVIRDGGGEPVAVFGTTLDTTELRRKERELQEKNAELERFNYTISHDLKSPLVTIKTFLGYLEGDLAGPDTARIERDIFYIRTAADKMGRLLEELLEMSRVGRMINPPVPVSFRELVEEALGVVAGSIEKRRVDVRVGDEDVVLCGDRPRLVEIWQNLLENSVKFMGDQASPRIEVGVGPESRDTIFFVRDNGMGIDPRYQEKVFGMFEKLDAKNEGTGLGLALVKRIVELYGGTVWLESEGLGHGACFKFTLPGAVMDPSEGAKG